MNSSATLATTQYNHPSPTNSAISDGQLTEKPAASLKIPLPDSVTLLLMGDSTGGHESPHALNSYKDNVIYDFFKVIFECKRASDKSTIMYTTAEHLVVSLHLFINHSTQK
ncbi:hypothetical protein M8J75_001719 [Diaphorina citri]|nr:hypothetical protein M8J75_001719 [Diaphorina citri]